MYSTSFIKKETVDSFEIIPPKGHPMYVVDGPYRNIQIIAEMQNINKRSALMRTDRLLEENIVSGVELQELWFPTDGKFDIFLSHSHENIESARRFAAYIYNYYGVRVFVDSMYWGYAGDLIVRLTEKFAEEKIERIFYFMNIVHSMLSMALMKMMDKCETVCYLKSRNSVKARGSNDFTKSSWIYEEVEFANRLHKVLPIRTGHSILLNECKSFTEKDFKIEFKADLSNFVELESEFWERMRSDSWSRLNDFPIQERLLDRITKSIWRISITINNKIMTELFTYKESEQYINLLQENINRMSSNSSNCKNWMLTIVSAIYGFRRKQE